MGVWGTGISSDDNAADLLDDYRGCKRRHIFGMWYAAFICAGCIGDSFWNSAENSEASSYYPGKSGHQSDRIGQQSSCVILLMHDSITTKTSTLVKIKFRKAARGPR